MTCLFLSKGLWIITVHNAYQLKSACSGNQNSKASIKWKMRSRHKIIPTNFKGFCEFGLEAVVLFHRILWGKKHFHSAFNFPTILRQRMGLHCIDVRLVSGIAAVSPHLPPALKWKSTSGHIWCDHCLWPQHFKHVQSILLYALV